MKPNDFAASIVADARARAAETDRKTKEELKALKEETKRLVNEKQEKLTAAVKREEEQERNRLEAKRHLEATIATLTTKQHVIDDAFRTAASEIAALPKAERERILTRLWARAQAQLTVGKVEASVQDAVFFKGKVPVTPIESIGGFIAHSEDGLVSVDLRFETILEQVRQQQLREIAHALFGGH